MIKKLVDAVLFIVFALVGLFVLGFKGAIIALVIWFLLTRYVLR